MGPRVAYVLKAFGRTSETFITNEIHLLEQLGLPLRMFSLKKLSGQKKHGALAAIESPVSHLPEVDELSDIGFARWLFRNLPKFAQAHSRVARARPALYAAVLAEALAMCVRYRVHWWSLPRKVFFKEFLQAGWIADRLRDEPEVVHLHAHFCHGATTVTMFAARLAGLPFSFTAHAKDIYLRELNPGNLLPLKMRRAEFVVTCTSANKTHLDAIRPEGAAPVHAIYHGLDTDMFAPPVAVAKPHPPRILSVGRFVEKKGFTYLVEACAQLRDRGHEFECVIVGGADAYQARVEKAIADHRLEDFVKLRNAVTQEELRGIYAGSSIFALPCQVLDNGDRDGIPNVLAEAMSMRLAVVSTNISGIPEIVESGRNGILVPPRDSNALANALAELLDEPARRRQLGLAARATILDVFDSRRNTATLADLFFERIGQPAPNHREAVSC